MNPEKLAKLQAQVAQVRIGGPGTARRKKKVVHRSAATDDKKLQSSLKKLAMNSIPGIEEVNMFKDDGTVIHFNNPKVQASLATNTFSVAGHAEQKQFAEMLPSIFNQLPSESLSQLRESIVGAAAAQNAAETGNDDDEVPELVENFDEPSKKEAAAAPASSEDASKATEADKKEPVAEKKEE